MTTKVATTVDGFGNTGTRVWPDFASLPAPRIGALALVDDGSTGTWYFGQSISGSAAWISLSALANAILKNPPSGWNVITDTNSGEFALIINGNTDGLGIVASNFPLSARQTAATPSEPVALLRRESQTDNIALVQAVPDGSFTQDVVNGHAEITVRTYTALPTMDATHLGAIVRKSPGSGVADTFWMGAYDALGAPEWVQFIGPTGPQGPAGPAGPTGPQGPQGDQGVISFPALPGPTEQVQFVMLIESDDSLLPWITPAGYTVLLVGCQGYWSSNDTPPLFINPCTGSDQLVNGLPRGLIVARENYLDSHGQVTGQGDPFDPRTPHTCTADCIIDFYENCTAGASVTGYTIGDIEVAGNARGWHAYIDFTTTRAGFADIFNGTTNWASGTGWFGANFTSGCQYTGTYPQLALDLCTITRITFRGSLAQYAGPGNNNAGVGAGTTHGTSYDLAEHRTNGAYTYDWTGNTGHDHNAPLPDTSCNVINFFSYSSACAGFGGSTTITSVDIYGTGIAPTQLQPYLV